MGARRAPLVDGCGERGVFLTVATSGGQSLGSCEAPGDNVDRNRRCLNKVELN